MARKKTRSDDTFVASAPARGKRKPATGKGEAPRANGKANGAGGEPPDFPVVGIGASAGGLEAITEMLRALASETGMAFVLVQHLDPTHASMLTEILSRATSMPVREVENQMPVEPNHVYVIPPGANMVIAGGVLKLSARTETRGQHRAIDHFLRSLAEQRGHQAIGVVLSGTGNDGTLGLEEIKAAGGLTFAQDDTAQQSGMPQHAVAAGCVDLVLPPREIAREIARIARHPYVAPAAGAGPSLDLREAELQRVLELLRKATGVDLAHYKHSTLYRRIHRRIVLHKLENLRQYLRFLEDDPKELDALYQDVLINVTSFFRNAEAFEVLKRRIFPRLAEGRSRHEPVRIWTLGCSTGEEAYSLAIAFVEHAELAGRAIPVQVFATDVNGASIEKARAGLYSKNITQDVSPERLRRFFVEEDGSYRISKEIRDRCVFAQHDVLAAPPFSHIDLACCRNLLIYLDSAAQQKLLPTLHYALKPHGFLWLGSSETIGSHRDLFELEEPKHQVYSRKPGPTRLPSGTAAAGGAAIRPLLAQVPGRSREASAGGTEAQREADRILLAKYAPAAVLINAGLEILQFRGDTGAYLSPAPGRASLDLLKMLRPGLLVAVRGAIHKARSEEIAVREEGLRVRSNGGYREVNVEAVPLAEGAGGRGSCLVLFEDAGSTAELRARVTRAEARAAEDAAEVLRQASPDREIVRLSQELAATREYLQSVIEQQEAANEELQSANEEVQSANEELQSINEELETSKEEIQSSNEELTTVNEELHTRNLELSRSNDDFTNLLSSVQIAIVMLGPDLRIRRFTPVAEKLLNLIAADVGRPIGDIRLNVDVPDLERLVTEVIDSVSPTQVEAQDKRGRWYSLRIRPYRTLDNKIDGAVLVLLDVDSLKRGEELLRASAERLRIVQEQAPVGIWEADLEGRFLRVNDTLCAITGYSRDELLSRRFQDITPTDDVERDADAYRRLPGELGLATPREIRYRHKDGRTLWIELSTSLVHDAEGKPQFGVGIVQEVTERKRAELALRESEQRFHVLADSAPGLIWVNGLEGCQFVNRAYLDFLGVAEREVQGYDWSEFIHPEDRDAYLGSYLEHLGRRAPFEAQFRFRRADGQYRWMKSVGVPRSADDGEFLGYVGSTFDVTDLKEAEAALQQSDRSKNEFLAMLAHELRNPLAPLRNIAEVLKAPAVDSGTLEWAQDMIDRQVRNMARMIDDLLDVSRITQGRVQLRKEPVELAALLKRTAELSRQTTATRHQQLTLSLPPEPIYVEADPLRLEQVFVNLLSNACKFTPAGGHLWLSAGSGEPGATDVEVRVRDDGDGIPAELLPRVFDLFMQADRSLERAHGGLGIGLTLVRSLVQLHGGSVEAKSDGPGKGSEFVVRLPVLAAEAVDAAARDAGPREASAAGGPRRILVVDDNADAASSMAMLLRLTGHEVEVVHSGQAALQAARGLKPHIVLLDIGLPGMDGNEVARRLRREPDVEDALLVAVSGYGKEEDRSRAWEAGFDHYFTKPLDLKALDDLLAGLPAPEE